MKIWGINPNEMTADWAPKRIQFREKISFMLMNGQQFQKKELVLYSRIQKKYRNLEGK